MLSSVSPQSLAFPSLRPFSIPPFRIPLSLFRAPSARLLSFPANEQADRAWAARIAFPSTLRRFHGSTYTFGCTCSRGTVTPSSSIIADLLHRRLSLSDAFFYLRQLRQRENCIFLYYTSILYLLSAKFLNER